MRLSLRFLLPLFVIFVLLAYLTEPLVDEFTSKWVSRDLNIRAKLLANALSDPLVESESLPPERQKQKVLSLFRKATQDGRLIALAFCQPGRPPLRSALLPKEVQCPSTRQSSSQITQLPEGLFHISVQPLLSSDADLIFVHDMKFAQELNRDLKAWIYLFFIFVNLLVSLMTVGIAYFSWRSWIQDLKSLLRVPRPTARNVPAELLPAVREIRHFIHEVEHQPRDESQVSWSAQTLKEVLRQDLTGEEVIIVSNREPYIHVQKEETIEVQRPASGVVTALEPIMRACSGTWIAHGSGSADRAVVDVDDKVAVPPDRPSYYLKRVWLTKEEEQGYYYGFANEGLWPLCHIAHTRPLFRTEDWEQYVAVNEKFAQAVVQESKTHDPVVLVQDYHLAMVPRLIKARLPEATIITFWHIPWPNPEAFGICPWREEILNGMLGSDLLGFHTRFHCNNFIDTVDRFLESRIDRDSTTISHEGSQTAVRNYPISIEWPLKALKTQEPVAACRHRVFQENHIQESVQLGVGVDRLDYTKGILERFYAVERLLELNPSWRGRLSFIQIGAPTRSTIREYKTFHEHVHREAKRINDKYGTESYKPLILRIRHHEPEDVIRYFRAADFCLVSSLHDGMNLVAKEFAASRDDELGVLILSQFAGAAKEMPEAILVNPYDIDQCARAIGLALEMKPEEQKARMRSMRSYIQEFNVFRWAGRMLLDAARMKQRRKFSNPLLPPHHSPTSSPLL